MTLNRDMRLCFEQDIVWDIGSPAKGRALEALHIYSTYDNHLQYLR